MQKKTVPTKTGTVTIADGYIDNKFFSQYFLRKKILFSTIPKGFQANSMRLTILNPFVIIVRLWKYF